MTKTNYADKLHAVHVARVFFLDFMRNRSEQEVQFGPDVFINQPYGLQAQRSRRNLYTK